MESENASPLLDFVVNYFTFYYVSLLLFLIAGVLVLWRTFRRRKKNPKNRLKNHLSFRYLNDRFDSDVDSLQRELQKHPFLPKAALKLLRKAQKKEGKSEEQDTKSDSQTTLEKIKEQLDSGLSTEEVIGKHSNRVYVLSFTGNIMASAVEQLREEISFLLQIALPSDEIVVRLTSPGGAVAQYGYASSQLLRLRQAGLKLAYFSQSGLVWSQVGSKWAEIGPMLGPSWLQLGSWVYVGPTFGSPTAPGPSQASPDP